MSNANTEVTLEAMESAVAAQLAAQFPSFSTVEFYRVDQSETMPMPALLLELGRVETAFGRDGGTGQWPALLYFNVRVVLDNLQDNVAHELRKAATSVAVYLHGRRWTGIHTDPAQVIACGPDTATLAGSFTAWRVEWAQLAFLGENVWLEEGTSVSEAYLSFVPRVGIPHEADYTLISAGPSL